MRARTIPAAARRIIRSDSHCRTSCPPSWCTPGGGLRGGFLVRRFPKALRQPALRHLTAAFQRLFVGPAPHLTRVIDLFPIQELEPFAHDKGPGIGDGALGDQAAAEWDLPGQFPRYSTPSERAGADR